MTNAAVDQLSAVLREQMGLCERMLAVTDRERDAVIASDVEALTALVDEKEHLLELLATLETERMTALVALSAAMGQPIDAITLSMVAEAIPSNEREALLDAGNRLRVTAEALQQANARNAHLLQASAELIERWMQYLRLVVSNTLTYSAGGSAHSLPDARVFDRTA